MSLLNRRLADLLETSELAALGPGPRPSCLSASDLNHALDKIFPRPESSSQEQASIRALLLLWYDYLDEAHSLAQEIPTSEGSFVHAIMHRREPDYSNAKYWFHRVGQHPAFTAIARSAETFVGADKRTLLSRLSPNGTWDPFAFVDCCQEEARSASGGELFLRQIQKAESSALLDHLASSL